MIRDSGGDDVFLDMSYGWFNHAEDFNVSFGWRFDPVRGRGSFIAERQCLLVDRKIPVPANAEDVLRQLYGPQWHVPDQGFSVFRRLHRDQKYLLSEQEIASLSTN